MLGKAELLEAIAGKNRGLLATKTEQQAILAAIAQLEDRNPTSRPTEASHLLEGDWRLLFTTSQGLLGIDRFPFFNLGQVYQCIRTQGTRIYNIAEVKGPPLLEGLVSVVAQFTPTSERRVNVKFNRTIVGLQRWIGYQLPKTFIQRLEAGEQLTAIDFKIDRRDQQGWLDLTYLDEDLRIGRGNQGSVFVLTKVKS